MSTPPVYTVPEITTSDGGRLREDQRARLEDLRLLSTMLSEDLISLEEYQQRKSLLLDGLGEDTATRKLSNRGGPGLLVSKNFKDPARPRRHSNPRLNVGHHNTIDPGLKLLGKRLNYFNIPSLVRGTPARRPSLAKKLTCLCPCSKEETSFDSLGHHQVTFAQKLAEGMMKGKTQKNVLHAPRTPLMYRIVSTMKYTPKIKLFCFAIAVLMFSAILVASLYFLGGCGVDEYLFGIIFLQSLTQLFGAVPEGINVTRAHCSILFSITSGLGVAFKSFAFAFCVGILQEAAPNILFSRIATVRKRNGVPILMVRVDAPASRCLLDVHASGEWFYTAVTEEKEKHYKFEPLHFESQSTLQLSSVLSHVIDHTSQEKI